jgi:hypothetical protein
VLTRTAARLPYHLRPKHSFPGRRDPPYPKTGWPGSPPEVVLELWENRRVGFFSPSGSVPRAQVAKCEPLARNPGSEYHSKWHFVWEPFAMTGKAIFAMLLGACLTVPGGAGADEARIPSARVHVYKHYFGRWFGPRSHYAAGVQTGVYDSCWRRRVIYTQWGPEVLSKWICHNYTTYGSHFDWDYGTAPADRFYGGDGWR